MSRIDEIIAKQKELAEELELAKQQERDAVLKDIKEKIKMFDFKASDFKGMFKGASDFNVESRSGVTSRVGRRRAGLGCGSSSSS